MLYRLNGRDCIYYNYHVRFGMHGSFVLLFLFCNHGVCIKLEHEKVTPK